MSHQSLKEQVDAFTKGSPLSIACPLTRYHGSSSYCNLPRHERLHWRGLFQPASGVVSGHFLLDEQLLPGVPPKSRKREFIPHHPAILCHCKPLADNWEPVGSENRFPDIPDRWDIYLLLRHQFDAIAFTGKSLAAIIRRTESTYGTILKLRDWEAAPDGGLYRRTRVRSQLKRRLGREPFSYEIERAHAKTALTYLGYNLPGKPKPRHESWAGLLRELGFEVETTGDIRPTRHVSMSYMQQCAYKKRYPERSLSHS